MRSSPPATITHTEFLGKSNPPSYQSFRGLEDPFSHISFKRQSCFSVIVRRGQRMAACQFSFLTVKLRPFFTLALLRTARFDQHSHPLAGRQERAATQPSKSVPRPAEPYKAPH